MEFSPFETDLDDDERGHTERNLTRLMSTPPADGPLRFAAISDSHQQYDELADVVDAINDRDDVAFVLHLGDMTDLGLRQEYRWLLERLRRLRVPFFAAIGNHDTISNGSAVYRNMFGPYDYTFDYHNVRVVLLNTNEWEFKGAAPDLDWLAEVSMPSPGVDAVIVAGHQRPPSGSYEDVLVDNQVSALVTGHLHRFDVERVRDIPAVLVGSTQARSWALLTVDGDEISVAECIASVCTPRALP